MTEDEKKETKRIIDEQIESLREEIEELKELTKPVKLDTSVGRLSRMDAINNKAINDKQFHEKKVRFKSWSVCWRDMERISWASA